MSTIFSFDVGIASIGAAVKNDDGIIDLYTEKLSSVEKKQKNEKIKKEDIFLKGSSTSYKKYKREKKQSRKTKDRLKQRSNNLIKVFNKLGFINDINQIANNLSDIENYRLRKKATHDKITPLEFCQVLYQLNKRRGYLSNTKNQILDDEDNLSNKNNDKDFKDKLKNTEEKIKQEYNNIPCNYFLSILENFNYNDENRKRKGIIPQRYQTINEFNAVWDEQEKYNPVLKDENIKKEIIYSIMPINNFHKNYWLKKPLKEFVRDYIIFYQRPLKSQKNKLNNCPLEESINIKKPVCNSSNPIFQEFRIWHDINNIKINGNFLNNEQKEILFDFLDKNKKLGKKDASEILKINKKNIPDNFPLKGNSTKIEIIKSCKQSELNYDWIDNNEKLLDLWERIYSSSSFKEKKKKINKFFKLDLNSDKSNELAKLSFHGSPTGSYSVRALKKILPLMRAGKYFNYDNIPIIAKKRIGKDDKNEYQGLNFYDAKTLIYKNEIITSDKNNTITIKKPKDLEKLKVENGELRNPLVEKIINHVIKVIKILWIRNNKRPDEIRIELARELKKSNQERKNIIKKQNYNKKKKQEAENELKNNLNREIKNKDIERYLLWKETDKICVYSGKEIPLEYVLNENVLEIDHIIPRKYSWNESSFKNKVLVYAEENKNKGAKLPREYIQNWKEFTNRLESLKNISDVKKKHLYADYNDDDIFQNFNDAQLTQTGFITKKIASILKLIPLSGEFITMKGEFVDWVKEEWGLNNIYKNNILEPRLDEMVNHGIINEKEKKEYIKSKRYDHRHHGLDAMVIANINKRDIRKSAELHKYNDNIKERLSQKPDGIEENVKRMLLQTPTIEKPNDCIFKPTTNYIKKRDANNFKFYQQKIKQRGSLMFSLHDETFYGLSYQLIKLSLKDFLNGNYEIKNIQSKNSREIIKMIKEEYKKYLNGRKSNENKLEDFLNNFPAYNDNGEKIDWVFYLKKVNTKKIEINKITKNNIDRVIDYDLREKMRHHLNEYGDDAFNNENKLKEFLKNNDINIKKVKINSNNEKSLKHFKTEKDPNEKKFIQSNDNYLIILYKDGAREFIKKYDVVQNKKNNSKLYQISENKPYVKLFSKDLVYFLDNEENKENIYNNWQYKTRKDVIKRLYKYNRTSNNDIYFTPINMSQAYPNEFGSINDIVKCQGKNISENCIKVKIDEYNDSIEPVSFETN